jgi:hypothetical protein
LERCWTTIQGQGRTDNSGDDGLGNALGRKQNTAP